MTDARTLGVSWYAAFDEYIYLHRYELGTVTVDK